MKLPATMYFLKPGWWALHVLSIPALFGGGVWLGHAHEASQAHGASQAHVGEHPAPASLTGNVLRDEMHDLQLAFDKLNQGVVLGSADGVVEAFHKVHARKQATEAALEAGTVRPPRNADKLEAFVARDQAFHAVIEGAVKAARSNDLPAMRASSAEMLDGCVACHTEYR